MYPYIESICIENDRPLHLDYHQERLNKTYEHAYGGPVPFNLDKLIKCPDDLSLGKMKLRFLYAKQSFRYEIKPYTPKIIRSLRIVLDDKIDYRYKRSERKDLNRLLARKGECDDILIIKNGFVSDTSAANICFFDGKIWLTPDTPLLEGTCRARLLKEGRIQETRIMLEHIPLFESYCLINAMREGFDDPCPVSSIIHHL